MRLKLAAREAGAAPIEAPVSCRLRIPAIGQKRSNEDAPLTGLSAGGKLKHSIAS